MRRTNSSSYGKKVSGKMARSDSERSKSIGARRKRDVPVTGGVRRAALSRPVRMNRSMLSHTVLPDSISTSVSTCLDGYWSAGRMTAAAGNYMSVYLNKLPSPFSTPVFQATLNNVTYTFGNHATLLQGFNMSDSPLTFSQLGSLYTKYVVKKYRLEITVCPGVTTDDCRLVVFPSGEEEIPSTSAGSTNLRVLESQPYALATTASTGLGAQGTQNRLVLEGYPWNDVGISKQQYMDDQNLLGANTPANVDFAGIYFQQLNGANNTATVTFQMKLIQEVELYDLQAQIN